MLSAKGIEPKSGWIAGYPVTPDILAEIEKSVAAAAEAQNLGTGKDEALKTVDGIVAQLGLRVQPGIPQAPTGETQQVSPPPQVVNNYYYDYGPPVVTYYAPPYPYDYLYAWVPFPFWCSGFFFGGFFVLHDFQRHIVFHNRTFVVTNHFVNPSTHRVFVVDPASRHLGWNAAANRVPSQQVFNSPRAQSSARTIVGQSWRRAAATNFSSTPRMGTRTAPSSMSRPPTVNQGRPGSFAERGSAGFHAPGGQRMMQPRSELGPSLGGEGRTFSLPARSPRAFIWAPRASSPPSVSQGHVSSAPATGFGRGSSFGGFHGGGSSFAGFRGGGGVFGGFHGGGHR